MKTITAVIILAGSLSMAGCANTGEHPLLSWMFGRKARQEQKVEARTGQAEDEVVRLAQKEVRKTGVALDAAAQENPASRSVAVAKRTNTNADALLTQRAPLPVAEADEAVRIVRDLLSEETARRESAEKSQGAAEDSARKLGAELDALRTQLDSLRKASAEEAANNLRLANELRAATLWKWLATAGTVLMTVAALAYRYNLGGLQVGVAEGLSKLQHRYGATDEDVSAVKSSIDAATLPYTQNQIFNLVAKAVAAKANSTSAT